MKLLNVRQKKVPCGLHACSRHALRLCRWAGFLSVQGLSKYTADEIKFNINSLYSIYHFATFIGQMFMTTFSLIYFFDTDVTLSSISYLIFYVTNFIAAILFMRLAQYWPRLLKIAQETEESLTMLELDHSTILKSTTIAYLVMTLAFVEHLLCNTFNVHLVMECLHEPTINDEVIASYMLQEMPYIFNYISYNIFYVALTKVLCVQATFIWSFTDVLTMCVSIYITSYIHSLNKTIRFKKANNTVSWRHVREHYSQLAVLLKEIDEQLSSFILLSFFTDLFFVCQQLFNSINRNNVYFKNCGEEETKRVLSSSVYLLYYLYSFFFLVLRAVCLFLFTANVHAAGQELIFSIYDVPSSDYDQEVLRFQSQLRFTQTGLTGICFSVTRNTILRVIGTIVTYELVLLQFSIRKDKITLPKAVNYDITATEGNSSTVEFN